MEETFTKWFKSTGYNTDEIAVAQDAWMGCKEEVMRILNQPLKNLDLSEDFCDTRYIEKIKDL